MTPLRQQAMLRRVKDITFGATLSLALLNGTVLLQSCGSADNQNQISYEQSTSSQFRQGVRTYITETSPGNFKITDEVETGPEQAGAIVNYFDGHRDTLSVEAARRLVQNDPSTSQYFNNPAQYGSYHSNGLANALLWGGLGYMIGRSTAPRYDYERRYSSGFYANPQTYQRANRLGEQIQRTARTTRPTGGRSGFFGGRSRGFSS